MSASSIGRGLGRRTRNFALASPPTPDIKVSGATRSPPRHASLIAKGVNVDSPPQDSNQSGSRERNTNQSWQGPRDNVVGYTQKRPTRREREFLMNEMQRTAHADCHCAAGRRNGVPRQVHFHNNDAQGDADKKSAIGTERLLHTAVRCQGGNGRQREGLG